jgi:aspartate carbamoyltransferase catalytic subunit
VNHHFTALTDLSSDAIHALMDRATYFSQTEPSILKKTLPYKVLANVFFEPSTRTRISFEMAAKRLGAEVINFDLSNSSVKKGESLYDTLRTLEAIGCDAIILRHADDRIFDLLTNNFKIPLINAGAGKFEHPSQGLLDLYTLRNEFGKLEGLHVAIIGDIKHSRVAGSMMLAAEKLKFKISLCAPSDLLPAELPNNCSVQDFKLTIPQVDAVMCLRNQLERHELIDMKPEVFHQEWGLTVERAEQMKKNAIIMHPAPINRGVEISDELVESPRSRIFQQMTNGVFIRMSILEWLLKEQK